jgi:uncharacterized membrane protein
MPRELRRDPPAVDENIDAIRVWERAELSQRSPGERIGETITRTAANTWVIAAHAVWFGFWILANSDLIPGITPFDPFPFPLLTTAVSLEAIFLTLFVLASQNRMSRHSDKRAELDLQINLLAEREMTAVLVLLQDIAKHLQVKVSEPQDRVGDLTKKTDVRRLADKIDDLPKE